MVVINLIIQLGWNYSNSFIIGKKFAYVLIVLYLVFFSVVDKENEGGVRRFQCECV